VHTRFTDEELAFRAEVREFFDEVLDEELLEMLQGAEASPRLKEGMIEYQRRLNAKGWMAPGWPVEFMMSSLSTRSTCGEWSLASDSCSLGQFHTFW